MLAPLLLLELAIEISGTPPISTGTARSNWTETDSWKTSPWLSVWMEWLGMLQPSRYRAPIGSLFESLMYQSRPMSWLKRSLARLRKTFSNPGGTMTSWGLAMAAAAAEGSIGLTVVGPMLSW